MGSDKVKYPLEDGTVYSQRKGFCPFSTPPLEEYVPVFGEGRVQAIRDAAAKLKGLRLLELNATARGGGVAEMLFSSIPFLNSLGLDVEWKVIRGPEEYYECTKGLHNLLQGMKGSFTPEMKQCYVGNMEAFAAANVLDNDHDAVLVHDPQPMGLVQYLRKPNQVWLWKCHIDIEETALRSNPTLWDFIMDQTTYYDAAIFTAAHYIVSCWLLPKFVIPPFIDPLSEKNRELSQEQVEKVLAKYHIDAKEPIIAQIGRYDRWKGIDRTIATYREVRKEKKCQLVLAGGLAGDDPEGAEVLAQVRDWAKGDDDIHVLLLPMDDRLENWREVNALQRAASVIMQPSIREGFGLTITEALWKRKPVIASDVGAISLQVKDGDTGFFFRTPSGSAGTIIRLLEKPELARRIGEKGRRYVEEHFLILDRILDYLMAVNLVVSGALKDESCRQCIVSFHPWYKLSKREKI